MPRLPTSLLRKARAIDPFLPPLLRACRGLRAAQNELRWLREYVEASAKDCSEKEQRSLLRGMVEDRASGKPLQYVMGTEYFGDLEIECRPGVLIPRQETAASVTHLAHLLRGAKGLPNELRVLDLCTGTGCIPLLFDHEFSATRHDARLRLLGIDLSKDALDLAKDNLGRLRKLGTIHDSTIADFIQADVLIDLWDEQRLDAPCVKAALNFSCHPSFWDVLISNPPYISPSAYWRTTTRSVRGFEPKLALVPPASEGATDTEQGDAFYPRLLTIASDIEAKVVLFEVADMEQALRVADLARRRNTFTGIEIWRDQPDLSIEGALPDTEYQGGFPVIGKGNGRSVLCWRGPGAAWLGKQDNLALVEAVNELSSSSQLEPQFAQRLLGSADDVPTYIRFWRPHVRTPHKLQNRGRQTSGDPARHDQPRSVASKALEKK